MPTVEELKAALAEAEEAERRDRPAAPAEDPYAPVEWGGAEYDFTVPSGQRCRLRRLQIEELAKQGILDRITRLPGLTSELVTKSQGLPPVKEPDMPDASQIKALSEVLDVLVPIVVVAPRVWPLPEGDEPRQPDRIYVDSIDFTDRVAIMHRVVEPLRKLDAFRNQS